eukprot:GHRR01006045.1.p1 GENE.GHRR01006045.1~~GHRR01006045.1.p1  ORF type:complete len:810 (+),score=341.24 GHRR01006045.1:739-3168(+)
MQHSLLKRISAFQTKEELLEFVAHYHMLLDPINLVTCLYRLAKMSKEASRGRNGYLAELQKNPTFQLLLRSISSKFLQGHLNFLHTHSEGLKGVDGRCLANLIWALAKLDLSTDDSALTTELALTVAPFIIRSLDSSSPQGLANMLWSYAKLPVAPPAVVTALVAKITDQLVLQSQRPDGVGTFDAQALSNSIWALAHLKSRGMDVDATRSPGIMRFMTELAGAAARALARPYASLPPPGSAGEMRLSEAQRYLSLVEREFSCQALVNIAWSFATLLGAACCQQPAIHQLFLLIHNESLTRLRCTALALSSGQPLPYVGGGGFNEQALSNAVYAFDKVNLLSTELLAAVFEVSALRLQRGGAMHHSDLASFKPQELCTLLKACHTNIAPPWAFLGSLLQLLSAHPSITDAWTAAERLELHRACQLYLAHQAEAASTGGMAHGGAAAVSAALGLANSIANSVSLVGSGRVSHTGSVSGISGSVASNGRISNTGSSMMPASPMVGTATPMGSSAANGSLFGTGTVQASRYPSSGPPSSSSTVFTQPNSGPISGGATRSRNSSATGSNVHPANGFGGDHITSTFGQLPAAAQQQPALERSQGLFGGRAPSPANQQQQFQQQQPQQLQQQCLRAQAGVGNGASATNVQAMQLLLQQQLAAEAFNCPLCGLLVRKQDALTHIEACSLARGGAANNLEVLLRQQQQQRAAAALAGQAAHLQQLQARQLQSQLQNQQLQNLLASQLQQQQQRELLAAAQQIVHSQQMLQQQQLGNSMLGVDDLCRPAGAVDANVLAPWMLEAAAASRPPLRPARRF